MITLFLFVREIFKIRVARKSIPKFKTSFSVASVFVNYFSSGTSVWKRYFSKPFTTLKAKFKMEKQKATKNLRTKYEKREIFVF